MASNNSPSLFKILLHLVLTVLTGRLWLIVLIIWYILKNK